MAEACGGVEEEGLRVEEEDCEGGREWRRKAVLLGWKKVEEEGC